jgi:mannose-6-phosphate isomerase-like protein (cupin superfamily)
MDNQHGTWGERVRLFQDENSLHTILTLKPNKRCSWHKHGHAYNMFYVISGELTIKTDIGPGVQRNYTTIGPGQSFTVKPGVMHEFQTKGYPTIMYEVAYVKYDTRDIFREQVGGDMVVTNSE